MGAGTTHVLAAIAIGGGASLIMDLWNTLLRQTLGEGSLNFCMLGRWILHMPLQFRHASIARSPRISGECVVGWTAHYVIGITFAFAFIVCTSGRWVEHPTLLPVLVYGIGTAIFPLFLLQPALGLGIASSQTPSPGKAVVKSLATHSVFGLGMYFCAIAFTSVAGVYP